MWKLIYKNKSGEWKLPSYKISLTHLISHMHTSVRERNIVATVRLKQNLPLLLVLMQIHENKSQCELQYFSLSSLEKHAMLLSYLQISMASKCMEDVHGPDRVLPLQIGSSTFRQQPGKWGHWICSLPLWEGHQRLVFLHTHSVLSWREEWLEVSCIRIEVTLYFGVVLGD